MAHRKNVLHNQIHSDAEPANMIDLNIPSTGDYPPSELDDSLSYLISQQDALLSSHVNQMKQNTASLAEQVKKLEQKLKEKEEEAERFQDLYRRSVRDMSFLHDYYLRQRKVAAGKGRSAASASASQEEVESCYVDVGSMKIECRQCCRRAATMVCLPCRHLSACLVCERLLNSCPICRTKKMVSFSVSLS